MIRRTFEKRRFIGISLAGGKANRTHMAVVDYFPSEKKLFLSHLFRDIGEAGDRSGDSVLVELINNHRDDLQSIAVDAPLVAPKCLRCKVACPGVENCKEKEIVWMWDHHRAQDAKKRPNKIFTPYTERCVEQFIGSGLEQKFQFDQALGSNRAPVWARTLFLRKRLKEISMLEIFPRLNVWRVGRALKISKATLLGYKNSIGGAVHRQFIIDKFLDSEWLFIYSQDVKHMVKDAYVFEAMISGFTAFLEYKKLCEAPPQGFPAGEAWIAFPKTDFSTQLEL